MTDKINTDASEFKIIENKKDEPQYKEVSKFVGGMIECIQFPNGDLLLINEEGKLMQLPLNPEATDEEVAWPWLQELWCKAMWSRNYHVLLVCTECHTCSQSFLRRGGSAELIGHTRRLCVECWLSSVNDTLLNVVFSL